VSKHIHEEITVCTWCQKDEIDKWKALAERLIVTLKSCDKFFKLAESEIGARAYLSIPRYDIDTKIREAREDGL